MTNKIKRIQNNIIEHNGIFYLLKEDGKIETREIHNFSIEYDYIFYIRLENGKKMKAFLPLDMLLKIINNENISIDELEKPYYSLPIKKTALIYYVLNNGSQSKPLLTKHIRRNQDDDFIYFEIKGEKSLRLLPKELKQNKLYSIAIKNNSNAIQFISNELKTKELCNYAVRDNCSNLEYIPKEMRTEELCKIAVGDCGETLEFVPDKLKTEKLCKAAVTIWKADLEFVPNKFKTIELCKLASDGYNNTLEFVPNELKTIDLCEIFVKDRYMSKKMSPFICDKICIQKDIKWQL